MSLHRCEGPLAQQFLSALEPWITAQRWFPHTASGLVPEALWELGQDTYVLVARASDGTQVQLPITVATDHTGKEVPADGSASPQFWRAWVDHCDVISGTRQELRVSASRVEAFPVEQSNTSVILAGGEKPLVAKIFRVLHPGVHPEVELPAALTGAGWNGVPTARASWYLPPLDSGDHRSCSAVIADFMTRAKDGFDYFVDLAARGADPAQEASQIGAVIASLHDHLESLFGTEVPLASGAVRARTERALDSLLDQTGDALDATTVKRVREVIASPTFLPSSLSAPTIRIHGDLHLGQMLATNGNQDWVVVDFEGEPLRALEERRHPDLAMRDVAGVLRSFDYAGAKGDVEDPHWVTRARRAFLEGYDQVRGLTEEDRATLNALELEKALYEVAYEATYRPSWAHIPAKGVDRIVSTPV